MTNKPLTIFLIALLVILGVLVYLEASAPQKLNWFPSYANTDKIPMGTYVVYNALENQQPEVEIKEITIPPYEFLTQDTTKGNTYLFINDRLKFDDQELDALLDWVRHGNTAFISSKEFNTKLLDTLHLDITNTVDMDNISTQAVVTLTNKNYKRKAGYHYTREGTTMNFSKIDTCNTLVLGTMKLFNTKDSKTTISDGDKRHTATKDAHETIQETKPNFVEHSFGDGTILLHTFPEAFSNYFMLEKENYTYTQNMMSYTDTKNTILWDSYYKAGKKSYSSPLYLLLANKHLKWAYYLVLIGTLLFVLFEGKRKQRSIPVIHSLKNQTLDFTRTISGMYFEKQQHQEIATKQITLFFDYIRNELRIPFDVIDHETIRKIASRSSNTIETTEALLNYIQQLQKQTSITSEQLLQLYTMITNFKN